jgi:hypothetical protein
LDIPLRSTPIYANGDSSSVRCSSPSRPHWTWHRRIVHDVLDSHLDDLVAFVAAVRRRMPAGV